MRVNGGLAAAPSLVEAAAALQHSKASALQEWPYAWVYPPPGSEGVNIQTVTPAPANATLTELLSFRVPDGSRFSLQGLLLTYVGIPVNDAVQQVVWNVDVNIPTSVSGAITLPALPSGWPVPDFANVLFHLGAMDVGPFPVSGPLLFNPRDTIRIKVTTTAPFPAVGSPVSFLTMLVGYRWPVLGN